MLTFLTDYYYRPIVITLSFSQLSTFRAIMVPINAKANNPILPACKGTINELFTHGYILLLEKIEFELIAICSNYLTK
jgi:hypothetical protein